MIERTVLFLTLLLFLVIFTVVGRAIATKQKLFGKPPIPAVFFMLAKALVLVNVTFLVLKSFSIPVNTIFGTTLFFKVIALILLFTGIIILALTALQLNRDLIFGLPSDTEHNLQTRGMYAISRHPFYLGFLFILFSSCILTPHFLNITALAGAWILHHLIMIREEQFLSERYGNSYRQYMKRVHRYLTFKLPAP
jgi:protein-S-isoprenylcysteine O-methyltransferase Ste14